MLERYRILIHSMTLTRDYSTMYVLARLLEDMGCDCFIASNENYLGRWLKAFNPHAVFFGTANKSRRLMEHYPGARFFFCAGEGGEDDAVFEERHFIDEPDILGRLTRIFFWGRNTFENIRLYTQRNTSDNSLFKMIDSGNQKVCLSGHPRLDLIRYGRVQKAVDQKTRVGLIGNSSMLNNAHSHHPLALIMQDPWRAEMLHYGLDLAKLYGEIIQRLPPEKFYISLRPYPLESRKAYTATRFYQEKRFELDQSLDFASWLNRQDIVIGDISSTLVSVFVSGCRYVNISRLVPRSEESYVFNLVTRLKEYTAANSAESFDALVQMIGQTDGPVWDARLVDLFDEMYDIKRTGSALMRIANEIRRALDSDPPKVGVGISAAVAKAISNLRYRRGSGYSFFRERDMRVHSREELEPIVANILAAAH